MVFQLIAKFSVRFRWPVVAACAIGVPLAIYTLPSVASVTKNDNSAFLPGNSASQEAGKLAEPLQGGANLTASTMVVSRESGPLTAADNAAVTRAEDKIRALAGVHSIREQGVSKDGK